MNYALMAGNAPTGHVPMLVKPIEPTAMRSNSFVFFYIGLLDTVGFASWTSFGLGYTLGMPGGLQRVVGWGSTVDQGWTLPTRGVSRFGWEW